MTFDLWTLGFQAVNVLVLIWLLHRFFWKPVAAMIAARQAAAATLLEEAEANGRQGRDCTGRNRRHTGRACRRA
jgi:F0F1-type ATP synthase membrane subunit b/b'